MWFLAQYIFVLWLKFETYKTKTSGKKHLTIYLFKLNKSSFPNPLGPRIQQTRKCSNFHDSFLILSFD